MSANRILFINQVAGPLFRELADDISAQYGGADLLSGHMKDIARQMVPQLNIIPGPDYNRRNLITRGLSWCHFFLVALLHVFKAPKGQLLFIVSNPPFLPLVGWLASVIRGQRYCMLVYDVYPGLLIQLGKIKGNGLVAISWRVFNRLVWSRAEVVLTIGEYMAAALRKEAPKIPECRFKVVPIWVDVDFIKPLPKAENSFLGKLGWRDRTIVMYSGNLGNTHNLDGLLLAAIELNSRSDIGFLIIGSGPLWRNIEETISKEKLQNVKLLPWQPEARLPLTQPASDISIISMEKKIAGFMLPGKTFYYMAAGSALIALVPENCEVADIVEKGKCGIRLDPDDGQGIARAILSLVEDPVQLDSFKRRSRQLAVNDYSRDNTKKYAQVLEKILNQIE
jgi:glycosyltransferase involved in cell wall biosynthesis